MSKKLIIFTDIGDTVIDQGTEVRNDCQVVVKASCFPGMRECMRRLHDEGYRICMVADGLVESFYNTMTLNGLDDIFEARAISEEVGAEKPDLRMFEAAGKRMGLSSQDKKRTVMIGNYMARDIAGAHAYGILGILVRFSDRYPKEPTCKAEIPDFKADSPEELYSLIGRLEEEIEEGSKKENCNG